MNNQQKRKVERIRERPIDEKAPSVTAPESNQEKKQKGPNRPST